MRIIKTLRTQCSLLRIIPGKCWDYGMEICTTGPLRTPSLNVHFIKTVNLEAFLIGELGKTHRKVSALYNCIHSSKHPSKSFDFLPGIVLLFWEQQKLDLYVYDFTKSGFDTWKFWFWYTVKESEKIAKMIDLRGCLKLIMKPHG